MVGIGISSASAASDAVSLASSSRSSRSSSSDGSTGFSDALSNSRNGRDDNATSRAAADARSTDAGNGQGDGSQTQDDASQPTTSSATTAAGNTGKPSDAPKAPGTTQSFAQALTAAPQAAQIPPGAADIAAPATDVEASKTSLGDVAQQLAAMVDGDASGQPVTDAKGNLPNVKGGKTTDATDKAGDDDASASDATATASTVSDALSLLGALPVTVVPAQTAASVLAAAGQLHSGNGKVVASSDGSVDAVSSDAVGDKADAVATGMAMLASKAIGSGSDDTGTATDNDDATQAFSVARVNSKVQALDLAASKNSDDAAQLDLKTAAGDGAGNVTVLESRRFVGLADGSNSSLVANSLTGNKDWAAAMSPSAALTGASATTSASKVMNSLKIQMNPDNLGIVTATMRLSGDQLSVDLKVQSAEAYRQLSNDQTAMADSLRQQGYSVDRITVSYTAPDTSSNSQSQGQPQQQFGASQGQGSDAQARKQNSGRQAGDQDNVWGTGTVGTDDSVAGSAQRARAGGVYL
jgi:chemotaxis protein MotD